MANADAPKLSRNLSVTGPDAAAEALEQADEYDSLFGATDLEIDSGDPIKVPPHPDYGMLDDEKMQEYEELLFEIDTEYEREPDIYIPEQRLRDENGVETGVVLPASNQRGALKRPYRKNGELVRPPHSVRVAQIALGETEYKRLVEGGKGAKDVWAIWSKQAMKIRERQQRDSKSAGSPVALAPVPQADS